MSKSSSDHPILAITMGDPKGIGPEIIAKALHEKDFQATPVIIGNATVLAEAFSRWAPDITLVADPAPLDAEEPSTVRLVDPVGDPSLMYPDLPEAAYIEHAVSGCLDGTYHAMVTAPISKRAMYDRGFAFPGHTEFIGQLTGVPHPTMMFVCDVLRVSLVTIHLPLHKVPGSVTSEALERTIRASEAAARGLFGIDRPRIAVCGLNPHAGEEGHLGTEEREVIQPVLDRLTDLDADVEGPFPADTIFSKAVGGAFDLVVAQYHDQGLIPVKVLGFGTSVNLTVGIPVIRTSVDHGVAYDIAGKGLADSSSMQSAIQLARQLANNRK